MLGWALVVGYEAWALYRRRRRADARWWEQTFSTGMQRFEAASRVRLTAALAFWGWATYHLHVEWRLKALPRA